MCKGSIYCESKMPDKKHLWCSECLDEYNLKIVLKPTPMVVSKNKI